MYRVFENKSQEWYDSMKLAGEYYGVTGDKIKNVIGKEVRLGTKKVHFTHTPLPVKKKVVKLPPKLSVYEQMIQDKELKWMLGGFYLSSKGEVWLYSKNKDTEVDGKWKRGRWYKWTTKDYDGDKVFYTKIWNDGYPVSKKVSINQYHKALFGVSKEVKAPF